MIKGVSQEMINCLRLEWAIGRYKKTHREVWFDPLTEAALIDWRKSHGSD